MRLLEGPEFGKRVLRRELAGVAGIDARDKGIEAVVDGFLAEVLADKLAEADVGRARARAAENVAEQAEFPAEGKQGRLEKATGRHGQVAELAAAHDEAFFCGGQRGDQLILQTERLDDLGEGGLAFEERIGAAFDEPALGALAADGAAEPPGLLEEAHGIAP